MSSLRHQYLDALEIDRWQLRTPGVVAANPSTAMPMPLEPVTPPVARAQPPFVPATNHDAAWLQLRDEVAACTRCPLHLTRSQTVFGVGDRNANWLIVGEAPGAEEDRRGEPFVGRAGQLLNSMLRALGLAREQVFIANILKSRPPDNRDPRPDEVAACIPFLHRQIELLQPKIMLAVGRIAAQNLLATDTGIGKLRGKEHRFGAAGTPLVITYHPAYLLRSPTEKRKAWDDLKFARTVYRRVLAGGAAA